MPQLNNASSTQPTKAEWVAAEQIRGLYRTAPAGLVAALIGAFLLAGVLPYVGSTPLPHIFWWLIFVLADFSLRLLLCRYYARCNTATSNWRPWARYFTLATLAGGLAWGIGAVWLITPGQPIQELLIMLVISATASGAMPAFGSYLPATYAYFIPAMLPYLLWALSRNDPLHFLLSLMDLVFMVAISVVAWYSNRHLRDSYRLRFDNMVLANDLQHQKEVAEQANLAKSRFLASASHDLRQPVHALGMFVSALRSRQMDHEAQRLVAHIDGSIHAMDSLFTALLDISCLDAGVVECHAKTFPIQTLLERVCRDYRQAALDKGLQLRLQPCSVIVHTDPVLLERILRNILSNAVRYTQQGGILVGCRRGQRVRLQVRDTGPGISAEYQERVFEEFYQVGNPERDRTQGLGLGLAIVRRLAALLDCPLEMVSTPAQGTLLSIGVRVADQASIQHDETQAPVGSLRCGLILVIDDEVSIQEAMRSLLKSWGHQVITAASEAEMLQHLAACPIRPDLIICDYRLRHHENGISVIQHLQTEYNDHIPAILITGDTAPDRLSEAQASGLLLLHKPVPHGKLRAAIGNLIGATPLP